VAEVSASLRVACGMCADASEPLTVILFADAAQEPGGLGRALAANWSLLRLPLAPPGRLWPDAVCGVAVRSPSPIGPSFGSSSPLTRAVRASDTPPRLAEMMALDVA